MSLRLILGVGIFYRRLPLKGEPRAMLGTMVRLALASPTTYATKLGQNKGLGPGLIGGMGSPQGSRRTGRMSLFLTTGCRVHRQRAAHFAASRGGRWASRSRPGKATGFLRIRGPVPAIDVPGLGSKGGVDYSGEAR